MKCFPPATADELCPAFPPLGVTPCDSHVFQRIHSRFSVILLSSYADEHWNAFLRTPALQCCPKTHPSIKLLYCFQGLVHRPVAIHVFTFFLHLARVCWARQCRKLGITTRMPCHRLPKNIVHAFMMRLLHK